MAEAIISDHSCQAQRTWTHKICKTLLLGSTVAPQSSTDTDAIPSSPLLRPMLEEWPAWKRSHPRFCNAFPTMCTDAVVECFRLAIMSAQDLRENMLLVGSCWFVPVVMACSLYGIRHMGRPATPCSGPALAHGVGADQVGTSYFDAYITWWTTGPQLSAKSLKIFLTALLLIELLGLSAPQTVVLSLPEMVQRVRAHPYGPSPELGFGRGFVGGDQPSLMPRLTYIFMPSLDDATADTYAFVFACLRNLLLVSWCVFLAAPHSWSRVSYLCYTYGMVVYVVMASLCTMFEESTPTLAGTCWFLIGATLAMPELETSRRARAWLFKFLLLSAFVPLYLSGGLSKLRYAGWLAMLTGSWLKEIVPGSIPVSLFPRFNLWAVQNPWIIPVMSWGCLMLEFVLPLMVLFSAGCRSKGWSLARWSQISLCCFAIVFHCGVFAVVQPNFVRQLALSAMIVVAAFNDDSETDEGEMGPPPRSYQYRMVFAMVLLAAWLGNQMWSDLDHIRGATPQVAHHDGVWPFPEVSMFVAPSMSSNYVRSLLLELLIAGGFCLRISWDVSRSLLPDDKRAQAQ